MANRTQRTFGILTALCLVAALGAWSCEQAGGTVGTPAGPSSATAAAKSGESTPAATPTPSYAPAPTTASKKDQEVDPLLYADMETALQDERHAVWAYEIVLGQLGPRVQPFNHIKDAEDRHVVAAAKLFEKRGWDLPASVSFDPLPVFTTLAEACAIGVDAERENIAMYNELLGSTLPDDVIKVFTTLRDASLTSHLPAFEKCAAK